MKTSAAVVGLLTAILVGTAPAQAQVAPGYTGIGPTVGLGSIGSASIAVGGRFEHLIKTLPEMGDGILGVEASVDFYSWNCGAAGYTCSVKYIPLGVTANYHFNIPSEPKLDVFLGLGLGYSTVSCSATGLTGVCTWNSALYFIGRAGGRYFFQPKTALYADLGAGAATLNVGVMFTLK